MTSLDDVIMYDWENEQVEARCARRLEKAAYELFLDPGYEQITVADIAKRAGLTEQTFFRYYADKREVLFGGSIALQDELLRALTELQPAIPTIEAVRIAVEAVSTLMHGRRALARERRRIVAAHADLQERELIKRAALAQALRRRGVPDRRPVSLPTWGWPCSTLDSAIG